MQHTMSVSFHCVTKAMMKAVTKTASPWKVRASFSAMPTWMRRPLEMAWVAMEPPEPMS